MQDFYAEVVEQLLRAGILDTDMKILVVCGGQKDLKVLRELHFRDVVISNVDPRPSPEQFAPFAWCYQDAEQLSFADASFDFCLVHSGLHHCYSPHRALLEMYRVARKGVLVFEPYDNVITRLGVRLNIGQAYEHASVVNNGFAYGGVANSAIPNYIYRWTQREIIKTIRCYAPQVDSDIRFIHKMRIPWNQLRARTNKTGYLLIRAAQPALKLIEAWFPGQSNCFATVIRKPEVPGKLHPWLHTVDGSVRLNEQWLTDRFHGRRLPQSGH